MANERLDRGLAKGLAGAPKCLSQINVGLPVSTTFKLQTG